MHIKFNAAVKIFCICFHSVQISLEQNTYTGSEASGLTEEICATVSAGLGNIVGTISATITPVQLAVANAATGNVYRAEGFLNCLCINLSSSIIIITTALSHCVMTLYFFSCV